jgi:hypothetical protein
MISRFFVRDVCGISGSREDPWNWNMSSRDVTNTMKIWNNYNYMVY